MSNQLTHLHVENFRSLANLNLKIDSLNVIFGPNGAGKTTLLDTIWFLRDCAIRGVDLASSEREHGIGLLWDGAEEGENISIEIAIPSIRYKVSFGYSSGRIEPFAGEMLVSDEYKEPLIVRSVGSDKAQIYRTDLQKLELITLREPEKLALNRYAAFENSAPAASNTDNLLRQVRRYDSRSASLFKIKRFGSESDAGDRLQDRCENLWSVLRNLHDKRVIDERYDTIISFMQESFPTFDNLFFEQTGRYTVYGNFLEKERRKPIRASGVSDGHLQMLINLTALFSEKQNSYALILFDEPEISLHPWALAVFAKAVKQAAEKWNKQVFIATHSPVLISQFEPENIFTAELDREGKTAIRRLDEIAGIQDLLAEYAAGSLYMAEAIAPQSKSLLEVVN